MKFPPSLQSRSGASPVQLSTLAVEMETLPSALVALLERSDGLDAPSGVVLYSTSALVERQLAYEVALYAPGWAVIGDDGQGRVVLLSPSRGPLLCDAGDMDPSSGIELAPDLASWVSDALNLPADTTSPEPRRVDVFLEARPSKPREWLLVKRELGLTDSVAALREVAHTLPTRLLRDVPYGKYFVRCGRVNAVSPLVALRPVDQANGVVGVPDSEA